MDENQQITSPLKAIKAYCLGCCYGSYDEMRQCTIKNCELYAFRFGKNPFMTRTYTEEQKTTLIENARKLTDKRKKKNQMKNVSSE